MIPLLFWILPFLILIPILIRIVRSKKSRKRRYILSCLIVTAMAFVQLVLHLLMAFGEAFVQGVNSGRLVVWLYIDSFILLISIVFIKQGNRTDEPSD